MSFDSIIKIPFFKNFSCQFIFTYVIPSDTLKDRVNASGNKYILNNAYGIKSQFQMTF